MPRPKITGPWPHPKPRYGLKWVLTVMRGSIVEHLYFATKAEATMEKRKLLGS